MYYVYCINLESQFNIVVRLDHCTIFRYAQWYRDLYLCCLFGVFSLSQIKERLMLVTMTPSSVKPPQLVMFFCQEVCSSMQWQHIQHRMSFWATGRMQQVHCHLVTEQALLLVYQRQGQLSGYFYAILVITVSYFTTIAFFSFFRLLLFSEEMDPHIHSDCSYKES